MVRLGRDQKDEYSAFCICAPASDAAAAILTRRANRRRKQSEVKKKRPWGTQFNSYYSQTQAYHFIKTSTH
ncbi:unnamed protein product [Onchocerca flexuosa]|uniref:Uncharacterized protein n=1 Tax=Onchocerca flexuosa TaxID=387005 RepID=A0A183I1A6_9BILA|nr:unnamed protein product [Onchocerca flexuosa]